MEIKEGLRYNHFYALNKKNKLEHVQALQA